MPGLTFSNELISRDEGLHTDFACCLYALLKHRLPEVTAHTYGVSLISPPTSLAGSFERPSTWRTHSAAKRCRSHWSVSTPRSCSSTFSLWQIGHSLHILHTSWTDIVFCCRLLVQLQYSKIYGASNPFDWMEMISLQGKTNFFERRVAEYQAAGVMDSLKSRNHYVFSTDADF